MEKSIAANSNIQVKYVLLVRAIEPVSCGMSEWVSLCKPLRKLKAIF